MSYTGPEAMLKRIAEFEAMLGARHYQQTLRDRADYKIGSWLSAALEDPAVCAKMKADIHEWFEAHQPGLISDTAALTPITDRSGAK